MKDRGYWPGGSELETVASLDVGMSCPYVKIEWDGGRELPDLQSNLCGKLRESVELGEHRKIER